MLKILEKIFDTNTIEIAKGESVPLHSHTSKKQGIFLQEMFDIVKPIRSIEIGLAYGISAMFILEKHREYGSLENAHLVIEPDTISYGNAALYNIENEGLSKYIDIRNDFSDKILAKLFLDNFRIQYAYIDTTKQFDVVLQDFYFINKIMDVGGVIIFDDCGGGWPGIQRLARFVNTLPHYKVLAGHNKLNPSFKKHIFQSFTSILFDLIPFKNLVYPSLNFKHDTELGLDFTCIAFQKMGEDTRNWDWDKTF